MTSKVHTPEETQMPTKPKAYSYLRFSTMDQAKGDSFRRQTALAEDYCRSKGLDLDKTLTFHDLGVSAFSGKNRKKGALRAFLDLVEEEVIEEGSYLLVESLDRVSREAILDAQATFLQIVHANITLVTLKGTPREYSKESVNANPTDLLISLLEMMRAREESEMKSQRIKADWTRKRERASQGEAVTSQIPAWLKKVGKTFEVVEERAEVVRNIYQWTLEGLGQHGIASRLTREGVPTFGSSEIWGRSYVKRILGASAVVGTFTPGRMVAGKRVALDPIENYFPPVISRETWDAVRALDKEDRKAPPREVRSLFSGLSRCADCGGPMTRVIKGHRKGATYSAFCCLRAKMGAGCDFRSVRVATVEDALISNLSKFTAEAPTSPEEALTAELAAVSQGISVTHEMIEGLVEAIAQKPLPSLVDRLGTLEAELADLKTRQERINGELRETDHPVVVKRLEDLEAILTSKPISRAKANVVLRQLVDEVVIHFNKEISHRKPGGTLEFRWKTGGVSWVHWGELFNREPRRRRATV
jgi:DNA invertase Pin-like site-specific DNA recombinase